MSIGVGLVPRPYADFGRVHCELVRASVVDRGGPDRKAERKECQGNRFELHFLIVGERKIPGAIRSCGLRFSCPAETRIPSPKGVLEVAVENFGSSL